MRPLAFAAALFLAACSSADAWPEDREANQLQVIRFRNGEGRPGSTQVPQCRESAAMITSDSVGPVRAGQTLKELRRACPELLHGWDWGDEGVPAPAVAVRLCDAVVTAELDSTLATSRVRAVTVEHGSARTPEGLGPGSTLGEMTRAWGAPRLIEGECVIEAAFPGREGLVWRLSIPGRPNCAQVGEIARANAADRLPPETMVSRVTQVGSGAAEPDRPSP
jgi:hypothetical protein